MISFHDVHKVYADGTVAVDNLNLEVPEGTLTVFVGPSGCGKTTLMRMINRMAEPTSGTVKVDGADVAGVDPVRLRLGIGYVIQGAGLMPHQRVIDNVATVPVLKGQSRRAARKAAYAVLERVGLDAKLANRYPAQLSGGEQQRVGVARALAADPPILLMDEPFSAVDPIVRHELQREILRLQAELHKTIVFVTHDVDEAVRLADRVAVFGPGGSLQQYEEPARLLSRPANDFVARMIGAGRGYRWLQFLDATQLPVHDIARIAESAIGDAQLRDGWALVVKADGAPLGWIDAERHAQAPRRRIAARQCDLRRFALPPGRQPEPGAGRRVVVAGSDGCGRRQGGQGHRGSAGRRCAGRPGIQPAGLAVHYLVTHLPTAWTLTVIHLRLSLVPVLAGLAIALPWGVLVWRRAVLRRLTTVTASVVFTIPSLALFVVLPLLIPTRILDEANVIVALTLYTTALLVRAVFEALDAVPSQVRDAASAVGYRPIMRLLKVELPLSIPVLVAGLRVVVVTNISMVSVGAVIGIGGLGTWFTEGYQANKSDQIVAGIIAIFVLAIVIDVLIMLAGRLATPWDRVSRPGRRLLTAPVVGGSR